MITTGSAEMDAVCAAYRQIIGELSDEIAAKAALLSTLQTRLKELQGERAANVPEAKPAEGPPPF